MSTEPEPGEQEGGAAKAGSTPSPSLLPLQLLETLLTRGESWGVTELADALGLPKARVHRHLSNLRQAGYLSQDNEARRYQAGWRLVLLGQQIEARSQIVTMAKPVMARLRDSIGQTIVLSQLTDHGVTVTEVLQGGSPIDVILHVGTQFGYNSSAQGKVALAFASETQLESWSRLVTEERTPSTVTNEKTLWKQVDAVREQGWAAAPEETYRGVNALAAPVFAHNGEISCTLAIISSMHFLPDPPPEDVVTALTSAADDLSRALGHRHTT
ncbi:IclR family transcriptional regulator [Prauserella cavernicola]|uniref:IclR family transcriptional regulator n=1 Tax=Prauserella cavernicola TaxID=2800127 RepID=A0A934QWX7_9PSEU|nr:IclR family transcriptional regulator [Prauserella cavernicola]MBK1787951.1 IclR family transcriptional regulator [Prauserella cavernicola]